MSEDTIATLFGVEGFAVLDAEERDGVLHALIETVDNVAGCPTCGTMSTSIKERPVVEIADAPAGGRRVRVGWRKRRLRCLEDACPQQSFTERHPAFPARARLSHRLGRLIAGAVKDRSVAEVAREHCLGWHSAWRATKRTIEEELAGRPVGPTARMGLDETTYRRPRRFATRFVDLETGRLIDLVEGRSQACVAKWLSVFDRAAIAALVEVAMDPFAGYATALRRVAPHARITIDKFHAVRLANQMLTEVRQRRNQQQEGHRGRKGDPLYRARHDLMRPRERLRPRQAQRVGEAFRADRYDELAAVWLIKETFRDISLCRDRPGAHRALISASSPSSTWPRRRASPRPSAGGRASS